MTHSLHRAGTKESLKDDYIWQVYPSRGINDFDVPNRLRNVIDIVVSVGSPNWGDVYTGCSRKVPVDQIRQRLEVGSKLRGVITSRAQLAQFLEKMKKADIGFSVTISGLIDEVMDTAREIGLKPHSINLSLGVWGKKEFLPKDSILPITTMCGHHMISPQSVERAIEEVKKGKSVDDVVERMAETCPCGIFNNVRAKRLTEEEVKRSG